MARINNDKKATQAKVSEKLLLVKRNGEQFVITVDDILNSPEVTDKLSEILPGTLPTGTKIWKGILNQTFPNPPTDAVLQNTLGDDIVWSRTGNGIYRGTVTNGIFANPSTKVYLQLNDSCGIGFSLGCIYVIDDNTIEISVANPSSVLSDNMLYNTGLLIEVHP